MDKHHFNFAFPLYVWLLIGLMIIFVYSITVSKLMRHIQANFLLMSLHQASQYYILQFTHLWIWIIQVTKKLLYGANVPYLQTPTAPYNINARYWTGFMLLVYCALCCFSNDAHIKNFFAVIDFGDNK